MSTPRVSLVAIGTTGTVESIFTCPLTPEALSHSLPHNGAAQPETVTTTFRLDATNALMVSDPTTSQFGIHPQLALLQQLVAKPWLVLSWGVSRILPVQPIAANINEIAFDGALNPIRADITLTMHVITASADPVLAPFVQRAAERRGRLAALVPPSPAPPLQ
jgi:hypothetical protein